MIHSLDAFCHLFFLMLAGHALADGPLQVGNITHGKGSTRSLDREIACIQHGLIHGGAVALITGMWWLGVAEAVAHAVIDLAKGRKQISHATDQALHIGLKVIWTVIAVTLSG